MPGAPTNVQTTPQLTSSTEKGEDLLHALMWCLVVFVSVSAISSLLLSTYHRNLGTYDWTHLGNIGNFWAGHLGSFALVILALTLQLQRNQLLEQRKQFAEQREQTIQSLEAQRKEQQVLAEQLAAVRMDLEQQSLHFALEQLRALADRLPFRTVTFEIPDDSTDRVEMEPVRFGIRDLAMAVYSAAETNERTQVVVEDVLLEQYINLGDGAREAATTLGKPASEACLRICDTFVPPWLVACRDEARDRERATSAQILSAGIDASQTKEWEVKMKEGWRIRGAFPLAGEFVLLLRREAIHAPQALTIQATLPVTLGDVLSKALARLNAGAA